MTRKFRARTRKRLTIRYYEAEWWEYPGGRRTVMFREGPYMGKEYEEWEVAIARDEKWKLDM